MTPGKRKAPEGTGADADTRPEQPPESYSSHETYMRQLASRIRWLDGHTHWWIREFHRRQAERSDGDAA